MTTAICFESSLCEAGVHQHVMMIQFPGAWMNWPIISCLADHNYALDLVRA